MDSPVGAVLARYPRLGGSRSRNVFLLILEVRDPGAGGLVSPEASLLGFRVTAFFCGPRGLYSLCTSFVSLLFSGRQSY